MEFMKWELRKYKISKVIRISFYSLKLNIIKIKLILIIWTILRASRIVE